MQIKSIIWYLRKSWKLWGNLSNQYGWKKSVLENKPVDKYGKPIPWYTYSAIEFLRTLDFTNKTVFEFGCGNSSIFWASNGCEVYSVENDPAWANIVKAYNIPGLIIFEESDREQYANTPTKIDKKFDVIIIDGRFRHTCVAATLKAIKSEGLIIFDNADWYPDACSDLRKAGWLQVDFSGPGPINGYNWTTAIFFQSAISTPRKSNVRPLGGLPINNSRTQ